MFEPIFTITPELAQLLIEIEGLKQQIDALAITPAVLESLRETMRLATTRYSTYIEGNRLSQEYIEQVIHTGKTTEIKKKEEREVLGYYAALKETEALAKKKVMLSQANIQKIHALVINGGKTKITPSPYRTSQNVIRDSTTRKIVYLPPEAHDVPHLMEELTLWLASQNPELFPAPLKAAIAHYQFATIHPYMDGNGRTARLLATYILHMHGYGLKGLYSLEEYYAKNLHNYYHALDIGPSHNYYLGRAEADITAWILYFCRGMKESFAAVKKHARAQEKKMSNNYFF